MNALMGRSGALYSPSLSAGPFLQSLHLGLDLRRGRVGEARGERERRVEGEMMGLVLVVIIVVVVTSRSAGAELSTHGLIRVKGLHRGLVLVHVGARV